MTNNRILNLTVGWSFVLLGIAGAVLPVLQGALFFVVGLLFLSREYPWANRLLEWLKQKTARHFPRLSNVFARAEDFLTLEIQRMGQEAGYLRRRIWVMLAIVIGLSLLGWLCSILVRWLWHLVV